MADIMLEDKIKEKDENKMEKEKILQQLFPDTVPYIVYNEAQPVVYSAKGKIDYEPSYRNVTNMKNLPVHSNFENGDFPRGLYGTYNTLTEVIHIADHTRQDIEQRLITQIHEDMLHKNARLPDGYVLKALEELIAGEREKPRYRMSEFQTNSEHAQKPEVSDR